MTEPERDEDEALFRLIEELEQASESGRLDLETIDVPGLAAQFGLEPDQVEDVLVGYRELNRAVVAETVDLGGATPGADVRGAMEELQRSLPDDYRIESELGRGGMGVVYRVHQASLDRSLALKVLRPGEVFFEAAIRRFRTEARSLAKLRHRHIVPIHEVGEAGGTVYFTMAYVPGRTLDELIAAGELTPSQSVEIVRQVASAIAYAHSRGVVHRDLKPSNIIIDEQGDANVVDFGLALDTSDDGATVSQHLVGTPAYMSPEQARGDRDVIGEATDVYALGVVLYECLTGQPPFRGRSVAAMIDDVLHREPVPVTKARPDIARDLGRVCAKAMAKEVRERYASVAELLADLDRFREGLPVVATGLSWRYRFRYWSRRHGARVGFVLMALAFAASLAVRGFEGSDDSPDARWQLAEELSESGDHAAAARSLMSLVDDLDDTASIRVARERAMMAWVDAAMDARRAGQDLERERAIARAQLLLDNLDRVDDISGRRERDWVRAGLALLSGDDTKARKIHDQLRADVEPSLVEYAGARTPSSESELARWMWYRDLLRGDGFARVAAEFARTSARDAGSAVRALIDDPWFEEPVRFADALLGPRVIAHLSRVGLPTELADRVEDESSPRRSRLVAAELLSRLANFPTRLAADSSELRSREVAVSDVSLSTARGIAAQYRALESLPPAERWRATMIAGVEQWIGEFDERGPESFLPRWVEWNFGVRADSAEAAMAWWDVRRDADPAVWLERDLDRGRAWRDVSFEAVDRPGLLNSFRIFRDQPTEVLPVLPVSSPGFPDPDHLFSLGEVWTAETGAITLPGDLWLRVALFVPGPTAEPERRAIWRLHLRPGRSQRSKRVARIETSSAAETFSFQGRREPRNRGGQRVSVEIRAGYGPGDERVHGTVLVPRSVFLVADKLVEFAIAPGEVQLLIDQDRAAIVVAASQGSPVWNNERWKAELSGAIGELARRWDSGDFDDVSEAERIVAAAQVFPLPESRNALARLWRVPELQRSPAPFLLAGAAPDLDDPSIRRDVSMGLGNGTSMTALSRIFLASPDTSARELALERIRERGGTLTQLTRARRGAVEPSDPEWLQQRIEAELTTDASTWTLPVAIALWSVALFGLGWAWWYRDYSFGLESGPVLILVGLMFAYIRIDRLGYDLMPDAVALMFWALAAVLGLRHGDPRRFGAVAIAAFGALILGFAPVSPLPGLPTWFEVLAEGLTIGAMVGVVWLYSMEANSFQEKLREVDTGAVSLAIRKLLARMKKVKPISYYPLWICVWFRYTDSKTYFAGLIAFALVVGYTSRLLNWGRWARQLRAHHSFRTMTSR